MDMDFDTNLELQLEILTLVKNIEKFKKMGWSTSSLKNRLDTCRAQLKKHNKSFVEHPMKEMRMAA